MWGSCIDVLMITDGFLMSRVCYILSFCPWLRFSCYLLVPRSFFFDSSILQTVSDAEETKSFQKHYHVSEWHLSLQKRWACCLVNLDKVRLLVLVGDYKIANFNRWPFTTFQLNWVIQEMRRSRTGCCWGRFLSGTIHFGDLLPVHTSWSIQLCQKPHKLANPWFPAHPLTLSLSPFSLLCLRLYKFVAHLARQLTTTIYNPLVSTCFYYY